MNGGPSQVDTFDPKPLLTRDTASRCRSTKPRVESARDGQPARLALEVSPNTARRASGQRIVSRLGPARRRPVHLRSHARHESRPSAAPCSSCTPAATISCGRAWARGSSTGWAPRTRICPAFVTICPTLTHGGINNVVPQFLPAVYQGTPLGNARTCRPQVQVPVAVDYRAAPRRHPAVELDRWPKSTASIWPARGPMPASKARIASFELAYRMQTEPPKVAGPVRRNGRDAKLYGSTTRDTAISAGNA